MSDVDAAPRRFVVEPDLHRNLRRERQTRVVKRPGAPPKPSATPRNSRRRTRRVVPGLPPAEQAARDQGRARALLRARLAEDLVDARAVVIVLERLLAAVPTDGP